MDDPATTTTTPSRLYRGVSYDPATRMWRARIYCLGKHVTLGRYSTSSEAAFVHDRAAFYIHGEGAQTNYGLEAARQSNEREPPSSSWRVMSTLDTLARENKLRRLAVQHGLLARNRASHQQVILHRRGSEGEAAAAAATMRTTTTTTTTPDQTEGRLTLVQGLHFPAPFALLARAVDEDVGCAGLDAPSFAAPHWLSVQDRKITKAHRHQASKSASTKGFVYALVAAANRAVVVVGG